MITGYRVEDFIEQTEVSQNDLMVIVDADTKEMKNVKVSNLIPTVGSVQWVSVLNKPTDIVMDANYVHTDNNYSSPEKSKLGNIEANAQVNTVTSVAHKIGDVTLDKSDVGLSNVDNTSDANKPISTATQTALDTKVDKVQGKQLSTEDYSTLEKTKLQGIEEGANLYVKPISEPISYVEGLQGALDLKLESETITSLSFADNKLSYSDEAGLVTNIDLSAYLDNTNIVTSVASKIGDVVLDKSDVGLSDVDNTSDLGKPISNATQTALDTKVDKVQGKQLSTEDYTTSEKTKLQGIEEGANLYIKPLSEPISYIEGLQTALNLKLESETITSLVKVGNELQFTNETGNVSSIDLTMYLDDTNLARIIAGSYDSVTKTLIFTRDDNSTFSVDASMFFDDTNLVLSVNNKTGAVVLDKTDVGLENVDNTSDIDKPISTATQTALDAKVAVVEGKQLSTEDYTTSEKIKLQGIEDGANLYIKPVSEPISYIEGLQTALDSKLETETITSLSLSANVLTYTDEAGLTTNIDLSAYLGNTNIVTSVDGMIGDVVLSELYEPKDTSILKASDINVTVQPYDSYTVVDSTYVHTDNNFDNNYKAILDSYNPLMEVTTTNTVELTNKTLDSYTNKIGADNIHYRVKNDTQSIIYKGTIITSNGYNNGEDAIMVVPVSNLSQVAIGITKEDIGVGSFGLAINTGVIENIDTSMYPLDTIMYSAGNGLFTDVKPQSQFFQACGYVLRNNANTGSMLVEFTNPVSNVMRFNFVAVQNQTTFSVTNCILVSPMVYVDGRLITNGYSIVGSDVVFNVAITEGLTVNIIEYYNIVTQ